jgi:hypothetical protein
MKKIKITPQTYIDMNKEFEEDGTPFRIVIPTQESIDKWQSQPAQPYQTPPAVDMVQEMWDKIGGRPDDTI